MGGFKSFPSPQPGSEKAEEQSHSTSGKTFDPSVYLDQGNQMNPEQKHWWITDAKFINKIEDSVHGKFLMTASCLEFRVDRTKTYTMPHDSYDVTIDYLDIVSCSRLRIPNESSVYDEKDPDYKYSLMIQVEVSAINGLSVVHPARNADREGWQ